MPKCCECEHGKDISRMCYGVGASSNVRRVIPEYTCKYPGTKVITFRGITSPRNCPLRNKHNS